MFKLRQSPKYFHRSLLQRLIPGLLFCLALVSCVPEPTRDNPFDLAFSPANSNAIQGRIFSFYEPRSPLANVQVTLLPTGRFTFTDSEGNYQFSTITPGDYTLLAEQENFHPDSLRINVARESDLIVENFFLNGLPRIERSVFFSTHIDEIFPGEFFQATLSVIIADPDGVGDIDNLQFEIPEINFNRSFAATARPDSFTLTMLDIEFPETNLSPLVETGGIITLADKPGAVRQEGPFFLKRIIQETPAIVSPATFDTTTAFPTLNWQRLNLQFEFQYEIELFRIFGGTPFPTFSEKGISESAASLTISDSLADGQYLWTIGIRDQLNNFSRSEEARFVVINNN